MKYLVIAIIGLALTGCTNALYNAAVDAQLTVEDARRASAVFAATDNLAGVQCADFLAERLQVARDIHNALPAPENRGPLTRFALTHSAVETVGQMRTGGTDGFNRNCGALYLQARGNIFGIVSALP